MNNILNSCELLSAFENTCMCVCVCLCVRVSVYAIQKLPAAVEFFRFIFISCVFYLIYVLPFLVCRLFQKKHPLSFAQNVSFAAMMWIFFVGSLLHKGLMNSMLYQNHIFEWAEKHFFDILTLSLSFSSFVNIFFVRVPYIVLRLQFCNFIVAFWIWIFINLNIVALTVDCIHVSKFIL